MNRFRIALAFVGLLVVLATTTAPAAPTSWPFGPRYSNRVKMQRDFMPVYALYKPRWHKKGNRGGLHLFGRRATARRHATRPHASATRRRRHVFGLF